MAVVELYGPWSIVRGDLLLHVIQRAVVIGAAFSYVAAQEPGQPTLGLAAWGVCIPGRSRSFRATS